MNQDTSCQRILAEMIQLKIIDSTKEDAAWPYLKRIFGLGFDEGTTQPSKRKPVLQSTRDGKPVKIHPSIKEAAHKTKLNVSTIYRALKGTFETAGGYKWKYVNKEPNVSEETIESIQSKSTPPK